MCEHKAYWGLAAIASRMGWSNIYSPVRAISSMGFLMFKRRSGPRYKWYTNEALIQQWELSRCKLAAQDVMERERVAAEKRKRKKEDNGHVLTGPLTSGNVYVAEGTLRMDEQALGIAGAILRPQNAIPLPAVSSDNPVAYCGVDNSDHAQKEAK